jgi:hypothetical protein
MHMTTKKAPTALSMWIDSRKESAEKTAAYFDEKGLKIGRESIRRWKNGEPVGRHLLAGVSRITKISINSLLGA